MSGDAAEDVLFVFHSILRFSNVAFLDATSSPRFFLLFSQTSNVTVNRRIREFFVVPPSLGMLCRATTRPDQMETHDTHPHLFLEHPF